MPSSPLRKYQNNIKQAVYASILFVLLALLFLPQSLSGINIFDEGFIVSGAMLVIDGSLPYRDFLSMYGPGQYYVTAAIMSVLGESLIVVRFLHVILLAVLGLTIFALAKRASKEGVWSLLLLLVYVGIVLFAQPNVGYSAITSTLFLLLGALALGSWSDTLRANRLVLASCMIGIAGLFRWDFGIFGLLAIALTITIAVMHERRNTDQAVPVFSWLFAAVAPAMLILATIYIPLLVLFSSPVRWYREVLLFSLTGFSKWRNLEYLRPIYWSLVGSSSAITFDRSILKLAYLGLPIVLVIGAISTTMHVFIRRSVKTIERSKLVLIVYLAFLCLFLLNQTRVRPGLWQGFPAMISSLPLMLLLVKHFKAKIVRGSQLSMALNVIAFLLGAMLFNAALQGMFGSSNRQLIELNTPRSLGIRIEPGMKPYIDLVKYVRYNTQPGEAIYSGVQDHSRLFVNDAMLYFLTNRPPADRFLELEPGISNTWQGQEEIINSIKRKNVHMLILSNILSNEPNLTSRSNGVTILDEFIRANYHFDRSFGNRKVFVKN